VAELAGTARPGAEPRLERPSYDSARRPPPALEELVALWRYRDLVVQLVRRDIVTRYKRSVLGVLWTLLNPLGTMLILTVVFSRAFAAGRSYPVYVLTGLLAWNFFAHTTVAAIRHLSSSGVLIRRIYLPRTIFAVAAVGIGLLNFLLGLVPLCGIMLVTGVPLRPSLFFLPVSIAALAAFTLGVGLLVSVLAVNFSDTAEIYGILLPALLYLTPIIYPRSILPATADWLVGANPIHHLVALFRTPLYEGRLPDPASGAVALGTAAAALLLGWLVFTARADRLASQI
jgi:ABC-type polysaccharide/polyol phosphate export permease